MCWGCAPWPTSICSVQGATGGHCAVGSTEFLISVLGSEILLDNHPWGAVYGGTLSSPSPRVAEGPTRLGQCTSPPQKQLPISFRRPSARVGNVRVEPDDDGLDIAGIRPVDTRAPQGTNTAWNMRSGFRALDLCGLGGSFIPFAAIKEERLATVTPGNQHVLTGRADHPTHHPSEGGGAHEPAVSFLLTGSEAPSLSDQQDISLVRGEQSNGFP